MKKSQRIKFGVLILLTLLGGLLGRRALRDLADSRDALAAGRGPGDSPRELAKPPLRVLFVGNSYTSVNDLPAMIRHLAAAGGNTLRFEGVQECPGGFYLKRHWESGGAVGRLQAGRFDWMVLQEQSEVPSLGRAQLETGMYPFVARLHAAAGSAGARTLLFMTWGHRNGNSEYVPGDSYEAMQARITAGYEGIAGSLGVPVAPVGVAWRNAAASHPSPDLWQADGSHPSAAGTYLAACVFYDIFYRRSPVGNGYTANLNAPAALALQRIAAETVAGYPQPRGFRGTP